MAGNNIYVQGSYIDIHDNQVVNLSVDKGEVHVDQTTDSGVDKAVQRPVSSEQVGMALKQCGAYIWGHAAYSIAFCVCRDVYHMGDNASQYERMLSKWGIIIPAGTINTAMNRNQWMRYPIDSWEINGASARALKLRDAFKEEMETLLIDPGE
jgi:hypothetical protein